MFDRWGNAARGYPPKLGYYVCGKSCTCHATKHAELHTSWSMQFCSSITELSVQQSKEGPAPMWRAPACRRFGRQSRRDGHP
eukprot:2550655-Amphidinium_carterae.2